MAIIRNKDLINMTKDELGKKLAELKLELLKATKPGQGASSRTACQQHRKRDAPAFTNR